MKLIFCPRCTDVRRLFPADTTWCRCRASWGRYDDDLHATIGGAAVPLGYANGSFARALRHRTATGPGSTFLAFVMPLSCPTVRQEGQTS